MCVGNPQGGDADIGANAGHGRPSEPHHNALPPLPKAPPDHAIPNCLPNPMDPDENDVGPYSVEETPAKLPRQQVKARARKRNRGNDDSNATFMNDAGDGHLPAHVENDIADLGKLISLMQPGDIARAHEFGPTLEEYAVHGCRSIAGLTGPARRSTRPSNGALTLLPALPSPWSFSGTISNTRLTRASRKYSYGRTSRTTSHRT